MNTIHRSKKRTEVMTRAIQAVLMRERGLAYTEIAKELGYKDHTTVLYHVRNHEYVMVTDAVYRAVYNELSGMNNDIYTKKC